MSNDELAKIRQEIKESVLTEDLEQHHELYKDDITGGLSSHVQQEGWDEPAYTSGDFEPGMKTPAYNRGDFEPEMGTAQGFTRSGHFDPELAAAHGGDPEAHGAGLKTPSWESFKGDDDLGDAYAREETVQLPSELEAILGLSAPEFDPDLNLSRAVDPELKQFIGEENPSVSTRLGGGQHWSAAGSQSGMVPDVGTAGGFGTHQVPAYGRDMGAAYKGDTWDDLTGMTSEEAYNRPDDMWESKSATVRGWIIENFKPLRSDGYDPQRIVRVLNERPETELTPTMLRWFHENKKQLQKDGYDFDLVVDKLNED